MSKSSSPSPAVSRSWIWLAAAAITCGVLFAITILFPAFYLLGWLTFVPFLLGLERCRTARQAYAFGVLAGFVGYGVGTSWMAEFVHIFKEYSYLHSASLASLYWLFCAQIFGIIAALTHYARRGNAVLWAFPTVLTLVLAFYPVLFPWQIGHGQSEFLVAIQATDVTGVSGLDFILGMVAVLIAQALIGRKVFFERGALTAYTLIVAWFTYGFVSLSYWDSVEAQWDTLKVGLVQPDEPPSIGVPGPRPGFSLAYPVEMDLTEQLVAAGAELVIWPELRDKQYYTEPLVRAAYQRQMASLGSPLLFQTFEAQDSEAELLNFNASVLIDARGNESGNYRKMKRIAMAEYLPLFDDSATAKRWARRYLGEFFGNYSAGREPGTFDIGRASIKPFICYEIVFPHFVAASTRAAGSDILIVQSNNAWFGNTRVPYAHMSASVLRSVENRRPLVHVMNNGLGGASLPSGRRLLRTGRSEVAGYLVDVPFVKNGTTTFYSRFPWWFVSLLGAGLVLMFVRTYRSGRFD